MLALATHGRCIAWTRLHRLQAAAQLSNTILGLAWLPLMLDFSTGPAYI